MTITIHLGLFQYTKIPEGTAPASGDFQKTMKECIQGILDTISYLDNIYVTSRTNEEHVENLKKICKRLEEHGLHLNENKCDFVRDNIEVLEYVINRSGLHKAKSKVKAIVEAPCPNNKQLASFLGLINFYVRFLQNRSEKLKALFECMNRKNFNWTEEKAFVWVKEELNPRVYSHIMIQMKT